MTNKRIVKEILEWSACILIAVVLAIIVRYFLGTPTIVQQSSMYPTLEQNDRLILNRLYRTIKQAPKRGEIITFEAPEELQIQEINLENPIAKYEEKEEWFEKFTYYVLEIEKESYIKRIIGLPGEHVLIENGKVYINGEELEEPYIQDNVTTTEGTFNDITVPEGCVFVMGDNRGGSKDSREIGCIPIEKIESKVWFRFWPFNKFGGVD